MTYNPPITEDDLHGYIDHALDPTRRAAVQDYLDAHPDVAARITAYERQRNSLRSALRPIAEEPIPPQLNLRHIAEQRRRAWGLPWRSMAAAVLLLASGGAGGWSLPGHRRIAVGCPRHRRLGARGSVYVRHLRFRSRPSGGIWGGRARHSLSAGFPGDWDGPSQFRTSLPRVIASWEGAWLRRPTDRPGC